MPCYSVTTMGPTGHRQLYRGRLRHQAEDVYDRARPVAGDVVTLTAHTCPPVVLRRSNEAVVATCSRCRRPITGDLVPAVDSASGHDVCDDCTRAQRHLHRMSA